MLVLLFDTAHISSQRLLQQWLHKPVFQGIHTRIIHTTVDKTLTAQLAAMMYHLLTLQPLCRADMLSRMSAAEVDQPGTALV